jgi:hypothetical protein
MLALRFDLDDYSNMWASPHAALYFWGGFVVIMALIVGITLYAFRKMRPH